MGKKYGFDAFSERILPAMKKAVITSLVCTREALSHSRSPACSFELLGYDFMVDTDLNVWLIEVNTSPSMEYSTAITRRLVAACLRDTVSVILDGDTTQTCIGDPGFELLHVGSKVVEEHISPNVLSGLVVEGKSVKLVSSSLVPLPVEQKPSCKELTRRRDQEIEALI